ncbi:ATPase AAA domain-containing protein 2B [Lobosporangium transversale]|uniref:Bromo domain-containing protein n=1 Tax=Lobosporangium transversale TaxID=64571 RepID=A0A1Y2GBQ8_9FUNG|nr:hypothetical protein BCR41DRAFT_342511 [Lobosporangium transversale]KAF9917402.1 ATPase AAA domain-containing protein 2B [Lobosporangium transversale]ORZ01818.1 hypothetical protein BCR41DRAFT_342511 [Lobosporangium transversale]|eukprot:XP_021876115.1 hypothetical protein BCR41DRAFT_342511 [Lobosporangium transversale]
MEHDLSIDKTASPINNELYTLKRSIPSDNIEPHIGGSQDSGADYQMQENHNYPGNDMNDTKRRRIHGEEEFSDMYTTENHRINGGDPGKKNTSENEVSLSSTLSGKSIRTSTRTIKTSAVNSSELLRCKSQLPETPTGPRSLELRQQTKRINYAEEEGSEDEDEAQYERSATIRETQTRANKNQSRTSSRYHLESAQESDSDKSTGLGSEQQSDVFTSRTLRDRRLISAPKPFPVNNQPSRRSSNTRRHSEAHQSGGRYENSNRMYQSSSRSAAAKRAIPISRPITENMRITRGMSSSLLPDSANSRDVTPDQPSRQRGRSNSRFHRSDFTDEEQDLDDHEFKHDEAADMEDEEMEGGPADDEQTPGLANDEGNTLTRMTRLRARVQSQSAVGSRHASPRPSRSKATHSNPQQDGDRKYDLRERPKNRPAYIADRPIPSPSRPRSSRINNFSGRDTFARPRQARSNLLEALARAAGSSSDELQAPNFKRRSGGSSSSRILPMNMHELADSRRDIVAARFTQPADTDPLSVGNNVDFTKVGGLDHHIKSLKEMVILPLLYPEVYSHFQITPPRGVLFHGPPGTGKTLLARALASSCSTETQKVAFFMRKGADCLSKWVGEAERQLRLLFEEAKAWQPSIIFFDEIDGLCPVRSSKQEQIHASIVSTMLALMDGLDGRGQVIVIGATNRIDAIDPALRRPGRFDREFYFPLPNEAARRAIIDINTCGWAPPLDERFKDELARMTTQYCGADIKALCTEAALRAIRRRYPQIYESNEKLQIDASTITVEEIDVLKSAKALTPASYRVTGATASPLPENMKPLLLDQFDRACKVLNSIFSGSNTKIEKDGMLEDDDASFQSMGYRSFEKLKTFRPRMIITGDRGMGQRYIGPALLHYLEGCAVQQFDLAALMSESNRTPEAACVQYFIEVKRHAPSVIYIPHIDVWWSVVSDTVKATFSNMLEDLGPQDRILFLATSETTMSNLPITVQRWFPLGGKDYVELAHPKGKHRGAFFQALIDDLARPPSDFLPPPTALREPELLKKAPPPQPRVPTAEEKKLLAEHDQYVLRELRISLRNIVDELYKERKFKPFFRPVEPEESPDYYQIIKKPMDLMTISEKINDRMYLEVKEFLADIDLIVDNTTLYYDIQDPNRVIYRARAFQDVAYSMVGRLDPDLITETGKTATRVRQEAKVQQKIPGERMSRRILGLEATAVLDDPEMLLRSRTTQAKSALDFTREGIVGTSSIKADEDQSQKRSQNQQRLDALIAAQEAVNDQLSKDDADDSSTSLSILSSRATSSVLSVTAAPSVADECEEMMQALNGEIEIGQENLESADMSTQMKDNSDITKRLYATESPADVKTAAEFEHESEHSMSVEMRQAVKTEEEEEEVNEPKHVILDMDAVALLQQSLVRDTEGFNIEELDRLRASLYADIWENRGNWDKQDLLAEMTKKVATAVNLHYKLQENDLHASTMSDLLV